MAPLSPSPLTISVDGTPLPLVSTLRILGLFLQSNGKHTTLITQLSNTVHQTMRLIRRIANRHHGMREHDLRRLVQAFVLSRFVYSLPYLFLSRTEEDKVNCLIRQAYKSALSLPTSTSTDRLHSCRCRVHNSLTELTEAHRTAQLLRLSRTRPGRALLSTLKLSPLMPLPTSLPIPSHVSSLLAIDPLPKNMHPEHHPSRRAARASALWRKFGRQPAVAYVDAAPHRHYAAHALAVTDNSLRPTITASVCTSTSVEAEEAAIALAITQTSAEYIFSDSKPAVYNYAVGRVAPPAAGILRTRPDLQLRLVTWAEDVAARHCLDATTGSLKAAHNAAF
ncbi:hypothetical protein HPB50_010886 [Hyalomma asiaticum]|uniref:Uncharacterized protein n=1 Tax=Hyalomma asiaticum TaxID=266040 RepID=A0ACB7SX59_HYAAI|nr:hypothetical protein HPB50_010886 [Hyalomma asiaticum]